MFELNHLPTIIIVIFISVNVAYRSSFLHNKSIFRLSLLQIIYLVLIPSTLFIVLYSYITSLTRLPLSSNIIIRDSFLIEAALISFLLAYGGIAIHAVSKMLAETGLRTQNNQVSNLNRYFHLTFSHNLVYSGIVFTVACLVLLELNHVQPYDAQRPVVAVIKGLATALLLFVGMYTYTRSDDHYSGRWADLKATFFTVWIVLVLIVYGSWKTDTPISQFQLLLPTLIGFSLIAFFNLFLIARRIKRLHFSRHHPTASSRLKDKNSDHRSNNLKIILKGASKTKSKINTKKLSLETSLLNQLPTTTMGNQTMSPSDDLFRTPGLKK